MYVLKEARMIINKISSTNFVTRPAFKSQVSENKPETNTTSSVAMKGAEALASYNKPLLNNLEKLDIKPLDIDKTAIENIDGEKIYTSEGKLHSIVAENEDTKTTYTITDQNEVEKIVTIDKASGNVIRKQYNDGDSVTVMEFSAETGKPAAVTEYVDDKPVYASKTSYKPNGLEIEIVKDFEDNNYRIYETTPNRKIYRTAEFDGDKKLVSLNETKQHKTKTYDLDANFYNGALISIRKSEEITIPNTLGREKINNPEFMPADKFVDTEDLKTAEGEKTFYSNGAVEKNILPDSTEVFFNPDGSITKIKTSGKEIKFNDKYQQITETLADGREKITTYYSDNYSRVKIGEESISYNDKGNPTYYDSEKLSLGFNEQGMLDYSYSY